MHPAELNRAVARATQDSLSTIMRLGFLLADPDESLDPEAEELGPRVIDWDVLDTQRCETVVWRPDDDLAAA